MSELTDAIRQAGPQAVAAAIARDPAFGVFNLLWDTPEQIIPACDAMGWQTLDQLLAWVRGASDAVGPRFVGLVDSEAPIALQGLKTTPWPPLHEALFKTGLIEPDCLLHNADGSYHLPTRAQWEQIAAACPSKRWRHAGTEALDCDDFVRMALGWLSAKGLGNTACAYAATRHYLGSTLVGGHAVVLVWDNTLTPWQWEPQTGALHVVSHPKLGGNFLAQRVGYARVFA